MAAPPQAGAKGGLLKSLSPKQKRYATVVGAGALLALLYLLYRSHSGGEGQTPSNSTTATESAVPTSPVGGGGGGESGSAFNAAQGEAISQQLGQLSTLPETVSLGVGEVGQQVAQLGEGQDALGTSMGDQFSSLGTSISQGQERTAEALNKQNRTLEQISKRLKNKAGGRKPSSGGHPDPGKTGGGGGKSSGGGGGGAKPPAGGGGGGKSSGGGGDRGGGKKKH